MNDMMKLKNKKIVVMGLGKTGVSLCRFLTEKGASVTVTDAKNASALGDLPETLKKMGATVVLGEHRDGLFDDQALIILSPGVPHTLLPLRQAVARGIPVIGEVELASWFIQEPIIAVTGTNGKTTVTTLVTEMLQASGKSLFTGGNIGTPLIDYVTGGEKKELVVAEISSFQLDTIESFKPAVAVLLNITDDHLDRYRNFDDYAASKMRIFENQDENGRAVIYGDDPLLRGLSENVRSRQLYFGAKMESPLDAVISADQILLKTSGGSFSLEIKGLPLSGGHNYENIAAAALAALSAGASEAGIRTALSRFKGLPHRIEYVNEIHGVTFYDDSKATNVDAVVRALEAFSAPVLLIMGGRDKQGNFSLLKNHVKKHVKKIFLIGEAAPLIRKALDGCVDMDQAATMEEAVLKAHESALAGEVVLLSPACASFDMYRSYAHRGDDFRKAVVKRKESIA
jgi:UDP-N-acetylmuramoylalanine--D-glutamate ligase